MVRPWRLAGLLFGAVWLSACASISTTEDYDRATNFSAFKTYDWKETDPIQNQLLEQRIKSAVVPARSARPVQRLSRPNSSMPAANIADGMEGVVRKTLMEASVTASTAAANGISGTSVMQVREEQPPRPLRTLAGQQHPVMSTASSADCPLVAARQDTVGPRGPSASTPSRHMQVPTLRKKSRGAA